MEEGEREANTDSGDSMLVAKKCDSSDKAQLWRYVDNRIISTTKNMSISVDAWYQGAEVCLGGCKGLPGSVAVEDTAAAGTALIFNPEKGTLVTNSARGTLPNDVCLDISPTAGGGEALQLWAKPQPHGAVAIHLVNNHQSNTYAGVEVTLTEVGVKSPAATARDIWARKNLPAVRGGVLKLTVGPRDSAFVLLTPSKAEERPAGSSGSIEQLHHLPLRSDDDDGAVPDFATLNNTDWLSRVSDDPVLHSTLTLSECVLMCHAREDCVAVSWASPATPTKEDQHVCSFKCNALPEQRISATGHLGVIVKRNKVVCPPASWYPPAWQPGIDSGSLLLAGPKQQGAHIGNGYVAVWIKSLFGSQGPIQAGVEHVAGLFAGAVTANKSTNAGCVSWCDRAHKADVPSLTSTAAIDTLDGRSDHATASAMDLRRAVYLRASRTPDGQVECVQTTYAHRTQKHVLMAEFRCSNARSAPVAVRLAQPGPSPIAAPTAELTNASFSSQLPGVSCTKMRVKLAEAEGATRPMIAECHSDCDGATFSVPAGSREHFHACVSARHTSIDDYGAVRWPPQAGDDADPEGSERDPVPRAIASWVAANASAPELLSSHEAAMAELQRGGIEVEGDMHLARIINASMASLMNTYRADVTFGGSASGGLETDAYAGGTGGGWDIETWQWPVLIAFYPNMAASVLQYRVDRQQAAAANAQRVRGIPSGTLGRNITFDGLMYPWMSAFTGADNEPGNPFVSELSAASTNFPTEDHLAGDISLAFQQHWAATRNATWLRQRGFSVIEGIARFWASKAVRNSDGTYSIPQTQSPDEYHTNVTDSVYNNEIARISLLGANQLAAAAGAVPNATFSTIGNGLRILYDKTKDFHPEYLNFNTSSTIKQADVVLLDYPLQVKPETSQTQRNDLQLYAKITDRKIVILSRFACCPFR